MISVALSGGCITGEQAFIGGRLPNLCTHAFAACDVTSGCKLDDAHYIRGTFPGTRRVIVESPVDRATGFQVRFYLTRLDSPGTELLAQMYEPDCTLDTNFARVHLEDIDMFEEAGNDRTIILDELTVQQKGEHLLEIFSDASVEYLMVVDTVLLNF